MVHGKFFDELKNFNGVLERSLLFLVLLAVWAPSSLEAQTLKGHGKAAGLFLQKPAAPLYDVVALRISFQPDTSRFTTGDGTFTGALFDTLQSNVDPLPHNADYFDAHLQFLSNYIARVSDGKTQITTHLIPEVIQVSQQMAAYSPTGLDANSDLEIGKLAKLVEEAWTLADLQSSFDMSGFDPATTAFILFHAGVGRDIELVGTSLDKTPQDLPTIFFNDTTLDRLLPGSNIVFNDFPVQHTILMPRTESRLGFDFIQDVPFLVEFSINGLLAASFFNFLNVPDLFDTSTGESAIGPFGLMDPLGLFAYNGLFPPEPSAWTKFYLGWADLIEVDVENEQTITLSAAGTLSENSVAQVPVSASEYFLVENRNRDIENDGLNLTVFREGQTFTQHVENGDEGFNSININGFDGGVVVDVDDFDWALPGGVDADGNPLNGGILIWHIDERILAAGLPDNRVNTDPTHRGVDLEEADGAQDLGFPSDNIFGPQAFLGSPFDFFYKDNPVVVISSTGEEIRLYQNIFGPATYPNSNSNADGPSFVILDNFTAPGSTMSFDFRRDESVGVTPVDGFPTVESAQVPEGSYITSFPNVANGIIYQSGSGEIAVSVQHVANSIFLRSQAVKSPVVLPGDRLAALGVDAQDEAALLLLQNGASSSIPLGVDATNLSSDYNHLLYNNLENKLVALVDGEDRNSVLNIALDPNMEFQLSTLLDTQSSLFSLALTKRGEAAILGTEGVTFGCCEKKWPYALPEDAAVGQLVLGQDESGLVGAFTVPSEEKLVFLQADGSTSEVDLTQFEPAGDSYDLSRFPILVELDKDNHLEALFTYGPNLMAFSAGGGMADGFPISMPAPATTQPLVASFQESEGKTVMVGVADGYIYAFQLGEEGRQLPGFPLAVGANITATPLLKDGVLYSVDKGGSLKAWEIERLGEVWWRGQYNHQYNTSFIELEPVFESGFRSSNQLLYADENYNWPNPIREGKTYFRVAPSQDVHVTITIIDAAGGLVDRLEVENVRGNTTTDLLWQTNAASGLYYARVEAIASDGMAETQLIKMAIVR